MKTLKKLITFYVLFVCFAVPITYAQEKDSLRDDGTIPVEVQIRNEDYVIARNNFNTKLIFNKRAPQKWDTLEIPAGVSEMKFPSGNVNLKAWIDLPASKSRKKYPVVIFLHGGFSFGMEDWEMSRPYRDSGFIVMSPILRGENGQPGSFTLFYDEVIDVISAAEYIRKQPYADSNRIYVAGHSTGGTLAMLAAMTSNIFCAAASFSGSPDQIIFCKYGIPPEIIPFDTTDAAEFEIRSPLSFAKSFKCPARLFYGTEEPHFRLSTQQTALLAEENDLDVEAVEVTGDHFSALPEEIRMSILFFNLFKK